MNQILSNIQKVVDDSVLLFTLKVSEKYNVDQNELYDLWKEMCGNDDGNDSGNEVKKLNKRKITKKKTPKSKKDVKSPLEKKSIAALKKMCKERGLKKYSTLKKKQLVELLQNDDDKKEDPPLEDVLDDVLEDMGKLDIEEKKDEKKDPDFNEEEIIEEY